MVDIARARLSGGLGRRGFQRHQGFHHVQAGGLLVMRLQQGQGLRYLACGLRGARQRGRGQRRGQGFALKQRLQGLQGLAGLVHRQLQLTQQNARTSRLRRGVQGLIQQCKGSGGVALGVAFTRLLAQVMGLAHRKVGFAGVL